MNDRPNRQPATDVFLPKETPPSPAPLSGDQDPPAWLS